MTTSEIVLLPEHLIDQMDPAEKAAYIKYLEWHDNLADLYTYITKVSPQVIDYPFTRILCDHIDALLEGRLYKSGIGPPPVCVGTRMERSGQREIEVPVFQHPVTGEEPVYNLGIYAPPRHGKSFVVSEHTAGYAATKFAGLKVASCSYGDDLAAELSTKLQLHVEDGRKTYGVGVDGGTRANKYRWRFDNGSDYLCGGRGSGFSGFGWMLGIADDLFKDRADSDSAAIRNTVHGWWTSTWWTRRERWFDRTPARAILMNTRWHVDDISGRVVDKSDEWFVLRIPALAEDDGDDILGRLPGEALIPEVMSAAELEKLKARNPLDFASLYQGRPYVDGGNILHGPFNVCRLEDGLYTITDADGRTRFVPEMECFRFQIIDLAASVKKTADWTVIGTFDITPAHLGDRLMILRALKRMRVSTEDHEGEVVTEYMRMRAKFLGIEDKTFGTNLINGLRKRGGITVRPLKADTDKVTRAMPVDVLIRNEQLWWLADAAWRMDLEEEVLMFPDGTHDDQVDVLAYAARIFEQLPRPPKAPPQRPTTLQERVDERLRKRQRRRAVYHPELGRL